MEKQLIISISREYGSGGHHIAAELAERFGLSLYDHNLLDEIALAKCGSAEKIARYDEIPRKTFLARSVRGHSSSPEANVAEMQFDFLKEKAEAGESFVVVGRCSEYVLKEFEALIPIFVLGDREEKLKRIEQVRGFGEKDALAAMKRHDRKRKSYHNFYCNLPWGDSRAYDLCINSSKMGVEETANFLEQYIRIRVKQEQQG